MTESGPDWLTLLHIAPPCYNAYVFCAIVISITLDSSGGGRHSLIERPSRLSTADAVSLLVRRNYVIYEALRLKVVNYHALAAQIAPRVEELTGKRAKLAALVVSVKRFSDGMAEERTARLEGILEDAMVTLSGGVSEVSLRVKDVPPNQVLEDLLKMVPRLSAPPEVMQLPGVVKVMVHSEDGLLIEQELGKRFPTTVEGGLAKIGVRVSQKAEKMVGLATYITELLYRNGVVIHGAYIGRPDILLVVEEKFGTRAYEILREKSGKVGRPSGIAS